MLTFRIFQPYAFAGPNFWNITLDPGWRSTMGSIQQLINGEQDAPYAHQWAYRAPVVFSWLNMVVWGMGLPLGLAAWAGWAAAGIDLARGRGRHLVVWLGLTLLFLYLSTRWVKTMRYFLPLYPLLAVLAAYGLSRLWQAAARRTRRLGVAVTIVVVAGAALWAAAYFGIYLRPNTRLAASRWVYAHVPAGSTVANEHWDWGLPLPVDGQNPFGELYTGFEMANYDPDTPEKRAQLYDWLSRADYIFLASNRLYASISRLPEHYPLTTAYYRALFAGELGFELVADFTSYPALGPFRFPDQETPYPLQPPAHAAQAQWRLPLPPAEEAFSVYDHPRVLIFRKTVAYSPQRIEAVLGQIDLAQAKLSLTPREATSPTFRPEWAWFLGGLAALALAGLVVYLLSRSSRRSPDPTALP